MTETRRPFVLAENYQVFRSILEKKKWKPDWAIYVSSPDRLMGNRAEDMLIVWGFGWGRVPRETRQHAMALIALGAEEEEVDT